MRIIWHPEAWADYTRWTEQDRSIVRRINQLIRDIQRDPVAGLGKPERLRNDLSGWLSRRITTEHRLVYAIRDDTIEIASCRYHYHA